MKLQSIPKFRTKNELHKFVKDNQDTLMAEKRMQTKFADSFCYSPAIQAEVVADATQMMKAIGNGEPIPTKGQLRVLSVINSTNIIDSYLDMHIPSIWKKSLLENKNIKFLQEHDMKFDKIIADKGDLRAMAKSMRWSELGLPYKGVTECLIFDATIKAERNPYMYEQYSKGNVDQHSVGMQYVTMVQCIDNEDKYFKEEKENWDAYISLAVNPEAAEEYGFFYAVTQAKVIEGSAVVLGANNATPTLLVDEMEPAKSIPVSTQEPKKLTPIIDYDYLTRNINLFKTKTF